MITIKRFTPDQWESLKDGIMNIENNCFPKELKSNEEDAKKDCCSKDSVVFIAFENDKIVGAIYAGRLNVDDEVWDEGEWDNYKHLDKKLAYINSVGVLPEFQGKGIAKQLKEKTNTVLKELGYDYILSHSNEGAMVHIDLSFGAKIITKEENMCGSGETHYLTEMNLKSF